MVTLATLYVGRGLGLWITETRALNLPETILQVGSARLLGVPVPAIVLAVVLVAAHVVLARTPFGRHVYAVGHDPAAARRAGLPVGPDPVRGVRDERRPAPRSAARWRSPSSARCRRPSAGSGSSRRWRRRCSAGVSLFGGRGSVLPGVLLGALLVQTVENGLVIVNADPYLYPLVMACVIFLAVLLDSAREEGGDEARARQLHLHLGGRRARASRRRGP